MRRVTATAAALLTVLALSTACGSDDSTSGSGGSGGSGSEESVRTIDITVARR